MTRRARTQSYTKRSGTPCRPCPTECERRLHRFPQLPAGTASMVAPVCNCNLMSPRTCVVGAKSTPFSGRKAAPKTSHQANQPARNGSELAMGPLRLATQRGHGQYGFYNTKGCVPARLAKTLAERKELTAIKQGLGKIFPSPCVHAIGCRKCIRSAPLS